MQELGWRRVRVEQQVATRGRGHELQRTRPRSSRKYYSLDEWAPASTLSSTADAEWQLHCGRQFEGPRPCRRIGQTAPMPTTVRAGLATSTPMSSCSALRATRLARPLGERYGAAAVIHAAFVRGSPCRASSFRCAFAACATVRRLPMRGRCVPAASQDVASTCSQCEARATGLLLSFIATRGL